MTELERRISEGRRATMTPTQRANLERLAISNERFSQRIARLERGLEIGFRNIEQSSNKESEKP